jgi:hypothetical protein
VFFFKVSENKEKKEVEFFDTDFLSRRGAVSLVFSASVLLIRRRRISERNAIVHKGIPPLYKADCVQRSPELDC